MTLRLAFRFLNPSNRAPHPAPRFLIDCEIWNPRQPRTSTQYDPYLTYSASVFQRTEYYVSKFRLRCLSASREELFLYICSPT